MENQGFKHHLVDFFDAGENVKFSAQFWGVRAYQTTSFVKMTSTFAAEPADELFLKHHDFLSMHGSLHGSVHPVFLEDGIHYQVKGELIKKLPRRTEQSVKARVQWFGVLCLAGIGMFIEAYSKC